MPGPPSHRTLSSRRVSGCLVGQTREEVGFHCSRLSEATLSALTLAGEACLGWAVSQLCFHYLLLSQDQGWSHSQVNSWQQQLEWLRSTFPPDCLTLRRPKPTPGDSGGCVPPTVWATHPSQQLAIAPSLGLCPSHLFSLRETRK